MKELSLAEEISKERSKVTDLLIGHVQPLLGVIFRGEVCDEIKSSQASLSSAGDKHERRFCRRVSANG